MKASEAMAASGNTGAFVVRRPQQKRSRERFEAILNAAEAVLEWLEPHEVSIYILAEEAGMTPPSIYHFFPDASHVLFMLAERFFEVFAKAFETLPPVALTTWQETMDFRWDSSRTYFNSHPAARKILLGSGMAAEMRARDIDFDRMIARWGVAELQELFVMPEIPGLVDRITETIVINDALWALSVHTQGYISDEIAEQARRARVAYVRTFLPEYLPVRRPRKATVVQLEGSDSSGSLDNVVSVEEPTGL